MTSVLEPFRVRSEIGNPAAYFRLWKYAYSLNSETQGHWVRFVHPGTTELARVSSSDNGVVVRLFFAVIVVVLAESRDENVYINKIVVGKM